MVSAKLNHSGRERWIEHFTGALRATYGQTFRIEQADLCEDAGLVPVNVLVGNFSAIEFHDDCYRDFDAA
jgi:hypothetical protein